MEHNLNLNEVVNEYNNYIHAVSLGCVKLGEKLREENKSDALQDILNFSEGMQWITKANNYLIQNNINPTVDLTKIEEYLNEINDALQRQDYYLVADLFEYEITNYFDKMELVTIRN